MARRIGLVQCTSKDGVTRNPDVIKPGVIETNLIPGRHRQIKSAVKVGFRHDQRQRNIDSCLINVNAAADKRQITVF